MGFGLIGAHVNRAEGAAVELLCRWKPPVVVTIDQGDGWYELKRRSPQTVIIGRRVMDEFQPDFNQAIDPQAEAQRLFGHLESWIYRWHYVDYWQGVNEPVIQSAEAMARYAQFEIERMALLHRAGCRACLGNFAVGNPPNLAWWSEFIPALEAGAAYGAVLGLHQYWWNDYRDVWLGLRHRLVYNGERSHGWPGLRGMARLPLVLTECGRDYGVVEPGVVRGWRDALTVEEYLTELRSYDEMLMADPYILGAAVFCLGSESWQWTGYDIGGDLADGLAAQARPVYRRIQPPGPAPQKPAIIDLVDSLERHARDRYFRRKSPPQFVVLHHSGSRHGPNAELSVRAIARYHVRTRGWPGIGYHYVVGADGSIFQTNRHETVSYHAGGVNEKSLGVCLLGNFVSGPPPAAQVAAAVRLLTYLNLPVKPHRAVSRTACPGQAWEAVRAGLPPALIGGGE